MDDIDKFILTNFSKLDNKEKTKKVKPPIKIKEDQKLILSNLIDDSIYSTIVKENNKNQINVNFLFTK